MYEGLIEFIENSVFSVINQIEQDEENGLKQAELIVTSLLRFAQKNRGLTRVLIGDALVHENPRLQVRINQLLERIEASLKQSLRISSTQGALSAEHDFGAHANTLVAYVVGRWHLFVKSGFKTEPLSQLPQQWAVLKA
jgi:TetR/AcrR family transcriptional regulator